MLVWAGTEFFFLTVANVGLWFRFVLETVLIIKEHFKWCWAVLAQIQGPLCFSHSPAALAGHWLGGRKWFFIFASLVLLGFYCLCWVFFFTFSYNIIVDALLLLIIVIKIIIIIVTIINNCFFFFFLNPCIFSLSYFQFSPLCHWSEWAPELLLIHNHHTRQKGLIWYFCLLLGNSEVRTGLEHIPDQHECAGPALKRRVCSCPGQVDYTAYPSAREGFLLPVLPTKDSISCTGTVQSAPSDCSSQGSARILPQGPAAPEWAQLTPSYGPKQFLW